MKHDIKAFTSKRELVPHECIDDTTEIVFHFVNDLTKTITSIAQVYGFSVHYELSFCCAQATLANFVIFHVKI